MNNMEGEINISKKQVFWSIVVFILLFTLMNSWVQIPAGKRGVVTTFSAVSYVADDGLSFKIPFVQGVKAINVQTVKEEVETQAYTKDTQVVTANIALNYLIKPEAAGKIYKEVGMDFQSVIIDPAIQEAVKANVAKYTAQEFTEKREQIKEGIKSALFERLGPWDLEVKEFAITDFSFSREYEASVERKQIAEQNALTEKNNLEGAKFVAESTVVTAKANAEAIKIQSEAINQQGGSNYVQLKAVEKWKGEVPTYMMGSAVPFINIGK